MRGMQVVYSTCKPSHISFDVVSIDEPSTMGPWIPIHRKGRDTGLNPAVQDHDTLEATKGPVGSRNEAETSRIGVPSKELFLAMLTVLLSSPFDPHLMDIDQGRNENGKADSPMKGVSKDTEIIWDKGPGPMGRFNEMIQLRKQWVGSPRRLGPLSESATSNITLFKPIGQRSDKTVGRELRSELASQSMHLRVIWLPTIGDRFILLQIFEDGGQDMPHTRADRAMILSTVKTGEMGNEARNGQEVLLDSSDLDGLAVDRMPRA